MLFESTDNNNNMTDKELDEAVASHLKKLEALEIMGQLLEKTKLSTDSPPNETFCNECIASGDWTESSNTWLTNPNIINQEMLNLSTILGNTEWKTKNVYSMSNPNHLKSKIHSLCSDKQSEEIVKEEESSNYFVRMREYLVDYQETNGISRDEYSFGSLVKIMGQLTGKSFLALFYILVNIAPMAQILLFTSRFILDKILGILHANDNQQKAIKSAILGLQMISIYISLFFIFGSIWIPILQMVIGIISQIFFYN